MAKKRLGDDWTDNTSIRFPHGLKVQLDDICKGLKKEAGIDITRSELIVTAINYYLTYMFEATGPDDLKERVAIFRGLHKKPPL
jgi:hypothetical protein